MGTILITVCTDESFAVRLNDYLRTHRRGAGCDGYITAGGADDIYDALDSAPGGCDAALLVEKPLLDAVRDEIKRFRRVFPAKYTDYRLAVLTPEEDCSDASPDGMPKIFMFGRPSAIRSEVERFAAGSSVRTGVVAFFSPDGMARALFEPGGIHDWLTADGCSLRLVSTDEFAGGPVWDCGGDGFLRMLCDAKCRILRDFDSYASDGRVISAAGCAPDVYELGGDEADAVAGVICSGWSGITLIMLSSAASALNLGILRRCTRIVYIGEPAPAERVFGRYFAEDLSSVTDRIRFVGPDELSLCRRTGEWDTVWAHV